MYKSGFEIKIPFNKFGESVENNWLKDNIVETDWKIIDHCYSDNRSVLFFRDMSSAIMFGLMFDYTPTHYLRLRFSLWLRMAILIMVMLVVILFDLLKIDFEKYFDNCKISIYLRKMFNEWDSLD